MLKAILAYMDLHKRQARAVSSHNMADVLLRDTVALIICFFCDALQRRTLHEQITLAWHLTAARGFGCQAVMLHYSGRIRKMTQQVKDYLSLLPGITVQEFELAHGFSIYCRLDVSFAGM